MRGVRSGRREHGARWEPANLSRSTHLGFPCSSAHDDRVIGCITFYSTSKRTAIWDAAEPPQGKIRCRGGVGSCRRLSR